MSGVLTVNGQDTEVKIAPTDPSVDSGESGSLEGAEMLARVLLAVAVVIVAARLLGNVFRLINQPRVIGEIVAGILLGPSLLGPVLPRGHLFPVPVRGDQRAPDPGPVRADLLHVPHRRRARPQDDPRLGPHRGAGQPLLDRHPLHPGLAAALLIYPVVGSGDFTGFALFMGAAMAITAFPVLARILTDTGLHRTRIGALAITCAAVDDVTAWCILAVVVAIVKATGPGDAIVTVVLALAFVAFMVFVVRPLLARVAAVQPDEGRLGATIMSALIVALFLSAWATEAIGIHAIFGAFMFGAILPRSHSIAAQITERLEDVTVLFLLPVFFAVVGLSTQIGLVSGSDLWALTGLIIAIAIVGQDRRLGHRRAGRRGVVPVVDGPRRADERPGDHRDRDPHHRAQPRGHLAGAVHDDGADGAGHHLHDHAAAHRALPARIRSSRPGRRCDPGDDGPGLSGASGDGRGHRSDRPRGRFWSWPKCCADSTTRPATIILASVVRPPGYEQVRANLSAMDDAAADAADRARRGQGSPARTRDSRPRWRPPSGTIRRSELVRLVERRGAGMLLIGSHQAYLGFRPLGGIAGEILDRGQLRRGGAGRGRNPPGVGLRARSVSGTGESPPTSPRSTSRRAWPGASAAGAGDLADSGRAAGSDGRGASRWCSIEPTVAHALGGGRGHLVDGGGAAGSSTGSSRRSARRSSSGPRCRCSWCGVGSGPTSPTPCRYGSSRRWPSPEAGSGVGEAGAEERRPPRSGRAACSRIDSMTASRRGLGRGPKASIADSTVTRAARNGSGSSELRATSHTGRVTSDEARRPAMSARSTEPNSLLTLADGELAGLVEQSVDQVAGGVIHAGDVESIDDRRAIDGEEPGPGARPRCRAGGARCRAARRSGRGCRSP